MNVPDSSHVHGPAATSQDWWATFNGIAEAPLNGDTKAVLLVMLRYANGPAEIDKQGQPKRPLESAYPSVRRIMQHTGLGESTVRRKLSSLVADGWLIVTRKGGGDWATTYALAIPSKAPAAEHEDRGCTGDTPPASERGPLPPAGGDPSRQREGTDAVPTHDRRNSRSTAAAPRDEESATGEGEGSAAPVRLVQDFPDEPGVIRSEGQRIPDEVLRAVIAAGDAAKGNRWPLIALHEVIAPLYGEHFADWLIDGSVHFKAGMDTYDASAKLRTLMNVGPKHGVFPLDPPEARNVARIDHTNPQALAEMDRMEQSLIDAKAQAPDDEPAAQSDPEQSEADDQAWIGAELGMRSEAFERARARAREDAERKRRLANAAPPTAQDAQNAR